MKVCFGYIRSRSSYHILIRYGYTFDHLSRAVVYHSSTMTWESLNNFAIEIDVRGSNVISLDGEIYLLSKVPVDIIVGLNYIIKFDILTSSFYIISFPCATSYCSC